MSGGHWQKRRDGGSNIKCIVVTHVMTAQKVVQSIPPNFGKFTN
jgi:hypothetical protein